MEKEKSGKQILDDFFNEIGKLSNIDREIAQLFSTLYKVESPIDTSDHNGIAFFNFERDRINKAPELMIGFSADLHLTEKCKAIEYRISENTNFDLTEAIVKAKEFYQSKKDHFFKQ